MYCILIVLYCISIVYFVLHINLLHCIIIVLYIKCMYSIEFQFIVLHISCIPLHIILKNHVSINLGTMSLFFNCTYWVIQILPGSLIGLRGGGFQVVSILPKETRCNRSSEIENGKSCSGRRRWKRGSKFRTPFLIIHFPFSEPFFTFYGPDHLADCQRTICHLAICHGTDTETHTERNTQTHTEIHTHT